MTRISEPELIRPALWAMERNGGCISTSELIDVLSNELNPQGEDLEILDGRKDTKFSQKVRNLVSHGTLQDYARHDPIQHILCITDEGKRFLGI